jgi:hypothetical protein
LATAGAQQRPTLIDVADGREDVEDDHADAPGRGAGGGLGPAREVAPDKGTARVMQLCAVFDLVLLILFL